LKVKNELAHYSFLNIAPRVQGKSPVKMSAILVEKPPKKTNPEVVGALFGLFKLPL